MPIFLYRLGLWSSPLPFATASLKWRASKQALSESVSCFSISIGCFAPKTEAGLDHLPIQFCSGQFPKQSCLLDLHRSGQTLGLFRWQSPHASIDASSCRSSYPCQRAPPIVAQSSQWTLCYQFWLPPAFIPYFSPSDFHFHSFDLPCIEHHSHFGAACTHKSDQKAAASAVGAKCWASRVTSPAHRTFWDGHVSSASCCMWFQSGWARYRFEALWGAHHWINDLKCQCWRLYPWSACPFWCRWSSHSSNQSLSLPAGSQPHQPCAYFPSSLHWLPWAVLHGQAPIESWTDRNLSALVPATTLWAWLEDSASALPWSIFANLFPWRIYSSHWCRQRTLAQNSRSNWRCLSESNRCGLEDVDLQKESHQAVGPFAHSFWLLAQSTGSLIRRWQSRFANSSCYSLRQLPPWLLEFYLISTSRCLCLLGLRLCHARSHHLEYSSHTLRSQSNSLWYTCAPDLWSCPESEPQGPCSYFLCWPGGSGWCLRRMLLRHMQVPYSAIWFLCRFQASCCPKHAGSFDTLGFGCAAPFGVIFVSQHLRRSHHQLSMLDRNCSVCLIRSLCLSLLQSQAPAATCEGHWFISFSNLVVYPLKPTSLCLIWTTSLEAFPTSLNCSNERLALTCKTLQIQLDPCNALLMLAPLLTDAQAVPSMDSPKNSCDTNSLPSSSSPICFYSTFCSPPSHWPSKATASSTNGYSSASTAAPVAFAETSSTISACLYPKRQLEMSLDMLALHPLLDMKTVISSSLWIINSILQRIIDWFN